MPRLPLSLVSIAAWLLALSTQAAEPIRVEVSRDAWLSSYPLHFTFALLHRP